MTGDSSAAELPPAVRRVHMLISETIGRQVYKNLSGGCPGPRGVTELGVFVRACNKQIPLLRWKIKTRHLVAAELFNEKSRRSEDTNEERHPLLGNERRARHRRGRHGADTAGCPWGRAGCDWQASVGGGVGGATRPQLIAKLGNSGSP